jgi:hypothetical protein
MGTSLFFLKKKIKKTKTSLDPYLYLPIPLAYPADPPMPISPKLAKPAKISHTLAIH